MLYIGRGRLRVLHNELSLVVVRKETEEQGSVGVFSSSLLLLSMMDIKLDIKCACICLLALPNSTIRLE